MVNKYYFLFKDSIRKAYKNWQEFFIGAFLETSFFILFGFIYGPFRNAIGNNLVYLSDQITSNFDSEPIAEIVVSSNYFFRIIILSVLLWLIIYGLYCMLHGRIWRIVAKINGKIMPRYLKRFFCVNIPWSILFLAYIVIDFFIFYSDMVSSRIGADTNNLSRITMIMLILIGYLAIISYVLIAKMNTGKALKKTFKTGLKIHQLLPSLIAVAAIIAILNGISTLIGNMWFPLLIVFGLTVIMPVLMWSRIFIYATVEYNEN